jgi:hypothetical protein
MNEYYVASLTDVLTSAAYLVEIVGFMALKMIKSAVIIVSSKFSLKKSSI